MLFDAWLAHGGYHYGYLWAFQPEPRLFTDLAAALDDPAVEAVVLCTPNELHATQAAAVLEAGKHVLVEIPLAMSYAEGRALAELARRTGRTLMVAHTPRFHEAMRRVRRQVADGELRFGNVIARYLLLRRENVGSSGYIRSWTDSLLWHHAQPPWPTALRPQSRPQRGRKQPAAAGPRVHRGRARRTCAKRGSRHRPSRT